MQKKRNLGPAFDRGKCSMNLPPLYPAAQNSGRFRRNSDKSESGKKNADQRCS
jgi:hypothetical protein